jgi:hypothetical protein
VDGHHLKADLRSSPGWTCLGWRAICGRSGCSRTASEVPGGGGACDFRSRLKAQEEVAGIVLVAGVQDVPGGYLQGVVLCACHRAAGAHLVAARGPAAPCCVLLKRGSYSAAASSRIDSEGFDIAFQERFAIGYHRGPAPGLPSSAPIT